jgi:hypothetical protein
VSSNGRKNGRISLNRLVGKAISDLELRLGAVGAPLTTWRQDFNAQGKALKKLSLADVLVILNPYLKVDMPSRVSSF